MHGDERKKQIGTISIQLCRKYLFIKANRISKKISKIAKVLEHLIIFWSRGINFIRDQSLSTFRNLQPFSLCRVLDYGVITDALCDTCIDRYIPR